jgi:hypothetical protein
MEYIVYITKHILVIIAIPLCFAYWYAHEKGKAYGFERK